MNQSHKPPSIVVGIDGSKPAVQAALWAVDEAASRDIPLRLLYAIEPDDPGYAAHGAAARKLAAAENAVRYAFTAVEAADRPVKVEVEITQERPVTSLIRASAAAALVCVGAIGVHHFRPERVGSTAAALALSAQCPVAIVRPHRVPIGRDAAWIVVEADGSSDIGVLLGAVMAEARLRDSPVRVGHLPAIRSGRYRGRRPCQPGPLACPLATTVSRCAGAIGGSARRAAGLSGWAGSIGTHGGAQRERPGACGATCGSAGQRRVAGGRLHPAGRRSAVSVTVPLGSQTSWLSAAPVST